MDFFKIRLEFSEVWLLMKRWKSCDLSAKAIFGHRRDNLNNKSSKKSTRYYVKYPNSMSNNFETENYYFFIYQWPWQLEFFMEPISLNTFGGDFFWNITFCAQVMLFFWSQKGRDFYCFSFIVILDPKQFFKLLGLSEIFWALTSSRVFGKMF